MNVFTKSTIRKPLKTVLMLALLALMSFGFMARAVELMVINSEIGRLSQYYRPVGTLTPGDPQDYFISDGASLIAQAPELDFMDVNRECSGIMDGVYSADIDGYTEYNNIMYLYGSLLSADLKESERETIQMADSALVYRFVCTFNISIDDVVVGYPDYVQKGSTISVKLYTSDEELAKEVVSTAKVGTRYFWKVLLYPTPNSRGQINMNYWLAPFEDNSYFCPTDEGHEASVINDTVSADIAARQIYEKNAYLVTTKDMSMMPSMQKQYYLAKGRLLTREDDLQKNNVCVVRRELAELRGLDIGDTITMNVKNYPNYNVNAKDWEAAESVEKSYEIVGMYGSTENETITMYHSQMYVPDSTLPETWESEPIYSYFSFVLKSPEDAGAFLDGYGQQLSALGYEVKFMENGWEEFRDAILPIKQGAWVGMALFLVILVLVILLIAVIYLIVNKGTWTTARLLGLDQRRAQKQILLQSAVMGFTAIALGGLCSWNYALEKARESLSVLESESIGAVRVNLPVYWGIALCLGIGLLWIAMVWGGLGLWRRSSLLQLLSVGSVAHKAEKQSWQSDQPVSDHEPENKTAVTGKLSGTAQPSRTETHKKKAIGWSFLLRYIACHIRRTPLRGLLAVAVFAGFVVGLGWIYLNIGQDNKKIDQLYLEVPVNGALVARNSASYVPGDGIIPYEIYQYLKQSDYISDFKVAAGAQASFMAFDKGNIAKDTRQDEIDIRAVERLEDFADYEKGLLNVTFSEGYDSEIFETSQSLESGGVYLVLSEEFMELLGVSPGDDVLLTLAGSDGRAYAYPYHIVGSFTRGLTLRYDCIIPMSVLLQQIGENAIGLCQLDYWIKPEMNRELETIKDDMERLMEMPMPGKVVPLENVMRDDELRQAVEPLQKNVGLMKVLFPVVIAIAVIIMSLMSALFIMQSGKDISIQRLLGTTKLQVGLTLCIERTFVLLAGMALGIFLFAWVKPSGEMETMSIVLQCALCCTLSGVGVSMVTSVLLLKRSMMGMLHLKGE